MVTFAHKDYQILDKKRVYQGYFALDEIVVKHRLFNGGWCEPYNREIFERGSAAAVVLFDAKLKKTVLIEQFRPGAMNSSKTPWMVEVVAGIIEPGEKAEDVAVRESEEEANQKINQLVEIGSYFATPGGSSEKITLYCAEVDASDAEGVFGIADENEDIRVFSLTLEEVSQCLDEGVFENATTLIAMQWLMLNHNKLPALWQ